MNQLDKSKIKDILILSLIDSLSEIYSINLGINKDRIYKSIVSKLNEFDLLDINDNASSTQNLKNQITKFITNDLTSDIQLYNPVREISFFNGFQNLNKIGQGGNGWVYKVFNPLDKNYYAIKKIGISKNYSIALNEVRAMAKFNNKNIVRYFNSWIESKSFDEKIDLINTHLITDKSYSNELVKYSSDASDWEELDEANYNKFLFIQMELCKCNLQEYLSRNKLDIPMKLNICKQILEGIEYVHNNKYIHRDIKPSNIFLGSDNEFKIGDFGLVIEINDADDDVGTIGYTAPEVLNNSSYDNRADLYSLGVVFLEIFYEINTNMEKILLINDAKENKLEHEISELAIIVNGLIKYNPDNRFSIENCLEIINNINI